MQLDIVDYRNGKYQGQTNTTRQRHGLGVFIDDDLTFYASHWRHNKLNGPTLIYLTHGKYMYGQWKENEPEGLNVYRSGDTVLISKFQKGRPVEKGLLIFQRHHLASVMAENEESGGWDIQSSGPLTSHQSLVTEMGKIGLIMPDHYFSLIKYACTFSHGNQFVKVFPCLANHCYFGFVNGLAIVFNSDNGVVSVGHHANEQLCDFGGRFKGAKSAEEGSFQPEGERVSYKRLRPVAKIHLIFQNLHKKSLNFLNEYIDSKAKIFDSIQEIVRGKLKEIGEQGMRQKLIEEHISDSLDYVEYNEEESVRNYQNRERMYSPPKRKMDKIRAVEKNHSPYKVAGLGRDASKTKLHRPSPFKSRKHEDKEAENEESEERVPSAPSRQKSSILIKEEPLLFESGSSLHHPSDRCSRKPTEATKKQEGYEVHLLSSYSRKVYLEKNSDSEGIKIRQASQGSQNSQKSPTFGNYIHRLESKYGLSEKEGKKSVSGQQERQSDQSKKRQAGRSPLMAEGAKRKSSIELKNIARPSYEEIQERRKRVLRQFQELNGKRSGSKTMANEGNRRQTSHKNTQQQTSHKDSQESDFGVVPLSISNRMNRKQTLTPRKDGIRKAREEETNQSTFKKKEVALSPVNPATPQKITKDTLTHFSELNKQKRGHNLTDLESGQQLPKRGERREERPVEKVSLASSSNASGAKGTSPGVAKRRYVYLFE